MMNQALPWLARHRMLEGQMPLEDNRSSHPKSVSSPERGNSEMQAGEGLSRWPHAASKQLPTGQLIINYNSWAAILDVHILLSLAEHWGIHAGVNTPPQFHPFRNTSCRTRMQQECFGRTFQFLPKENFQRGCTAMLKQHKTWTGTTCIIKSRIFIRAPFEKQDFKTC